MTHVIDISKVDDAWLVPTKGITKLTGAKEYSGEVLNYLTGETTARLVTKIYDLIGRTWWVDTTTGSIYHEQSGKGFGPRVLQLPPLPTGRNVPDTYQRKEEAEVRFLNSQTEEQCNVTEDY
jgi:hypothetical protein